MPVDFHSPGFIESWPSSVRSDTLATPPTSHKSFGDIPYKAQDDDHISLSMKKGKSHRREWDETSPRWKTTAVRPPNRKSKTQTSGSRHRPRSLRKTHSLPTVQPRFDHGSVETFEAPGNAPKRARRWTVPSKAVSTCGLATLVQVDETASKTNSNDNTTTRAALSPAMITLRRATTVRSRRQTATLTSFPTPKFSRSSNGLLSSFLSSITGYDEIPVCTRRESNSKQTTTLKARKVSIMDIKNDLRPSTSGVAPPVQTEVVVVEPRISISEPNMVATSVRRCSTRYISESTVYEIIWDENWSSSSSSAGGMPSPYGRGSIMQTREFAGPDKLEERLSNVLSHSRQASVQESRSRGTSWLPGMESSLQSIWTNPKIARLFREPAFDEVPRSRSSKRDNLGSPVATDVDFEHATQRKRLVQEALCEHVEFFPPLRSRASTSGDKSLENGASGAAQVLLAPYEQQKYTATNPVWEDAPRKSVMSFYGSMIGSSSHSKRRSVSDHPEQWRRRMKSDGRRASEGVKRAGAFDDETVPLLVAT